MDIISWIREIEELDLLYLQEARARMNFVRIGNRIVNLDKVQTMHYEPNGGLNYDSPCVVIDFGGPENCISIFQKYDPVEFEVLRTWMSLRPSIYDEEVQS